MDKKQGRYKGLWQYCNRDDCEYASKCTLYIEKDNRHGKDVTKDQVCYKPKDTKDNEQIYCRR